MTPYVAYYRVSTNRQGRSGLGLEAQKMAVDQYVTLSRGAVIASYVEVESGTKRARPQLRAALDECRRAGAILLIAKLDRLSRSVSFIAGLMDGKVDFVAVDNPHANRLMLHLLAAFAEHEREMISIRTKAALAAASARGVELGKNGRVLAKLNCNRALEFAASVRPILEDINRCGATSLDGIARELNTRGCTGYSGGKWHATSVRRVVKRLEYLDLENAVDVLV